jgi:hypothetical protein
MTPSVYMMKTEYELTARKIDTNITSFTFLNKTF